MIDIEILQRPRKESVDGSSMDDSGNSDGEHRGEPQVSIMNFFRLRLLMVEFSINFATAFSHQDGSCDEQEQPARKKARRVYNMCATVG